MPDHLTPGVHIEEFVRGPHPVEGVATSVLGLVGRTERGPISPALVTSWSDFLRDFGGTTVEGRPARVAQAAHAFFLNGGQHLWVQRVPTSDPEDLAAGLAALADVDDITLVAIPDAADLPVEESAAAAAALVAHCEEQRHRFGLVDPPAGLDVDAVISFRSRFDSSRAALYVPWLEVADPGGSGGLVTVPPSGTVAGICARVDLTRGVHKAPVNEAPRGAFGLASDVTAADQARLTPAGVNAFRSFPGRGLLLWGARTMSSDPEWKYVNVRRLVMHLEHSIERSIRWAVFEPNAEPLWGAIRRSIAAFLVGGWRDGAFVGRTPDEAFFVRCDRTTMTQDDLDRGRLVALVGVAVLRPAEFVVLRIGQWTADADPT